MLRATGHARMVTCTAKEWLKRLRSSRARCARKHLCPCYGPLISRAQEKGDHNMGAVSTWLGESL